MKTITPNLWFDGHAEEAAEFYISLFPDSRIESYVAGDFAATSGMADVDRILQIEVFDHSRCVRGIVVHVVAVADLNSAPVATPVVGNNAVAFAEEVKQLSVPIVRTQRPAVMKDKRLRVSGTPILIEDLHSVFSRNGTHVFAPFDAITAGNFLRAAAARQAHVGEILAVVGPSGSGHSSFLRMAVRETNQTPDLPTRLATVSILWSSSSPNGVSSGRSSVARKEDGRS